MARRRLIEPNKKCNSCSTDKTIVWHKDKWGRIGWMCHNCYSGIRQREIWGFVNN